jgi:hypothetical protein
MAKNEKIITLYELLNAIEAVVECSDPDKQAALAVTIDQYERNFPDEFYWAVGAQSPHLLHEIMNVLRTACDSESQSKPHKRNRK